MSSTDADLKVWIDTPYRRADTHHPSPSGWSDFLERITLGPDTPLYGFDGVRVGVYRRDPEGVIDSVPGLVIKQPGEPGLGPAFETTPTVFENGTAVIEALAFAGARHRFPLVVTVGSDVIDYRSGFVCRDTSSRVLGTNLSRN